LLYPTELRAHFQEMQINQESPNIQTNFCITSFRDGVSPAVNANILRKYNELNIMECVY